MAAKDWAGVVAGMALAGFGLGAFVASGGRAPAPDPFPSVVEVIRPAQSERAAAVDIPGLSDAAGRVLVGSGYADPAPDGLDLPSAVISVLDRHGTVLLVPGDDGP